MTYYSQAQLAQAAGVSPQRLAYDIRQGKVLINPVYIRYMHKIYDETALVEVKRYLEGKAKLKQAKLDLIARQRAERKELYGR